jgi:hypothetical protein
VSIETGPVLLPPASLSSHAVEASVAAANAITNLGLGIYLTDLTPMKRNTRD